MKNSSLHKYMFKLEIEHVETYPILIIKKFRTLKLMRQWQNRLDIDNNIYILGYKEYIMNDSEEWEPFTIFGTSLVSLSKLKEAILRLENH